MHLSTAETQSRLDQLAAQCGELAVAVAAVGVTDAELADLDRLRAALSAKITTAEEVLATAARAKEALKDLLYEANELRSAAGATYRERNAISEAAAALETASVRLNSARRGVR